MDIMKEEWICRDKMDKVQGNKLFILLEFAGFKIGGTINRRDIDDEDWQVYPYIGVMDGTVYRWHSLVVFMGRDISYNAMVNKLQKIIKNQSNETI